MKTKIYLFDIDGTLVNAQGMGGKAFRRAVSEILGYTLDWQGRDFAGQTDAGLFQRALREAGSDRDLFAALADRYHAYLAQNLAEQPARILPGVEVLLHSLSGEPQVQIGLLTGNTAAGSQLKLGELAHRFPFGFFGDEHAERRGIGVVAANHLRSAYGPDTELIVVGDTPNDIDCARAAGARCIAVATGLYEKHELSEADVVLADLTEW